MSVQGNRYLVATALSTPAAVRITVNCEKTSVYSHSCLALPTPFSGFFSGMKNSEKHAEMNADRNKNRDAFGTSPKSFRTRPKKTRIAAMK